ncbi:MAG: hypothetical protein ABSA43_01060 [Candidatus Microgenomates bacterium]|jgi:large subunit ribosomal protein L1
MGKTKTAFVSDEEKNKRNEAKKKARKETKIHIAGLKGGQRIKAIESETVVTESAETEKGAEKKNKQVRVRVRGKKWAQAKSKIDRTKFYQLPDALKLVKETSYSKFDGTMEMHIQVKKVGVSANVTLPFSAGKQKRVEIANEGTIAKLKAGKIDFDILIATPEIMPKLVPFARVLGPKGLMPNPKNGTLVTDPKAIKTAPANLIALKTEKEAPLIHTVLGKVSQKDEELKANADAIIKALGGGKQIVKVHISSTMGPAVKIAI